MKVLFACAEAAPLAKTGGLGDVCAALPAALAAEGVEVRVLLPGYTSVLEQARDAREVARLRALASGYEARLLESRLPSGVPVWLVDCPELYRRAGGPYSDESGVDWPDNALRFGLFSRVASMLGTEARPVHWRPGLVHCHDWQAGLAPAYLRFAAPPRAATVMTIHNLAFLGIFDPSLLVELELPAASFSVEGLEFHGRASFMKAGLYYADAITAVSAGYAREIQTAMHGSGLHGLLATRAADLHGITNGIDTGLWDPSADARIPARYSARSLYRKKRNKDALQRRMGLEADAEVPLLGMVTRLTHQKGSDIVAAAAAALLELPAQLAVLGSGNREHERALAVLASAHPGRIAVQLGFDEELAHLIEAGADLFLMPSRFEPCGMNQMYSQRYGTPPVVHATGGLADTVTDCTPETLRSGEASGFCFAPATGEALLLAVRRAIGVYRDKRSWKQLQAGAMAKDFSWTRAAREYIALYREVQQRANERTG